MVVQDPNKKPSRKDVEAMFERVRRAGAQEGPVPEPARPAAARSSLFRALPTRLVARLDSKSKLLPKRQLRLLIPSFTTLSSGEMDSPSMEVH